ncbi:FecR family protein [Sphingobacterium sp. SG20118]|uniref:FecR family protein n=1 Tax=Sphingobacterium sp. SG20118 TaxID=3367156 RepID=UPI0037DFC469
MDKNRFSFLFAKYLANSLDEQESQELDGYFQQMDEHNFGDIVDDQIKPVIDNNFDKDRIFDHIIEVSAKAKAKPNMLRYVFLGKVAASVVLVSLFSFFIIRYTQTKKITQIGAAQNITITDIQLPYQEAMITLADGKQMLLDENLKDTIRYKGLAFVRLLDGTIAMNQDISKSHFKPQDKHHFSAPKGTTMRLLLPDSSIVYLNSSSSMDLYASFGRTERQLELDGEAFFEVAHNKDLPFVVSAKNTKVAVLGTKFNLSAYVTDNAVKTTLISGMVDVSANSKHKQITPGQQAVVDSKNSIVVEKTVDIRTVLAWKEGYFRFKNESIQKIMIDLAKWYPIEDVDIRFHSSDKFTGSLKRSKKLKDVLDGIEQISDLRFDIQEGRVIVMK